MRLVYKDLPILGPASVLGTKALLAAQKQDAYARMREAVMKLPPRHDDRADRGVRPRAGPGLAADGARHG